MKRLLLISNSTIFGRGYLDHAEADIREYLDGVREVAFVPYALYDRDAYEARAQERFAAIGYKLKSVHRAAQPRDVIGDADAVFIGGGNTFRLLKNLQEHDLVSTIRSRVESGVPYIGSSAGSVVASPTLKTTNDMPIVEPHSFEALGLVGFQINAHYLDPDPGSTHMGETRETRLKEFLEENDTPIAAIREGSMIRVDDAGIQLRGTNGARIFRPGADPVEVQPGDWIGHLLT
jgi:dipeptidase E